MLPERVTVTECPGCGDGLLIEGEKVERAEQTPPSLWYYAGADQQRVGPVTEQRATRLAQQGIITRDTLVWRPDMPDWQKMGDSRLGQLLAMHAAPGIPGAYPGTYPVSSLPQGLAVGGLVTGIAGVAITLTLWCVPIGFALSIAAMVLSGLALQRVKAGKAGGRGIAIAGLVLSIAAIAIVVIMVLVIGLVFHWKPPGIF